MAKENRVMFSTRMPTETKAWMQSFSEKTGLSLSDIFDLSIRRFLEEKDGIALDTYASTGRVTGRSQNLEFAPCGKYFISGKRLSEDGECLSTRYIYAVRKCADGRKASPEDFPTLEAAFGWMRAQFS